MFIKYSYENPTVTTDLGLNFKIEGKLEVEVDLLKLSETAKKDGKQIMDNLADLMAHCNKVATDSDNIKLNGEPLSPRNEQAVTL